jgi:predicted DsbA family dithiol-disulfide isomerase
MAQSLEIGVTFDYRCPFARNGHEAVVALIRGGSRPDVTWRFHPFSLDQVHTAEGEPAVWDRNPKDWGTGVLALLYGIAVRDAFPERFLDAHMALFGVRHDQGLKLDEEDALRDAVAAAGLDVDAVAEEVWSGRPLKTLAEQHLEAVERWGVFGVPTYLVGEDAVFIRFMERGRADDLDRAIDLIEWTRLNEFKRTRIPR